MGMRETNSHAARLHAAVSRQRNADDFSPVLCVLLSGGCSGSAGRGCAHAGGAGHGRT